MKTMRIAILIVLVVSLSACSRFGRGGKGSPDDGNIPLAGSEGVLPGINFGFDSSAIDSKAQGILNQNAAWLKQNTATQVVVEGHCDERGTDEYNLALGERRARATFDYLRNLGVPATQMSTISYGEEVPLDTGHDEAAWAKNRRAHFSGKR